MAEFWIVLEQDETILHTQHSELLSEVADIAQRQHEPVTLCAILLAAPESEMPDLAPLKTLGVQRLYVLHHHSLAHYTTSAYVATLGWLIAQHAPALIVTSATANGRDWTPRLAARLHLPFAPGCLSLDLHDDALFVLRPLYEGRAYVQTRLPLHGHTAIATLIPGIRGVVPRSGEHLATTTEVVHLTPKILREAGSERIHRVGVQAPSPEDVELEVAERIVAGGRGVGQSGFTTIAAFAQQLGAAVGATRVATDLGWVEHARQIGATGKIVHPQLYIACGISGAAQHTSGMSDAQTIIAINPDRSASIFSLADLGLLGDANQILPLAAKLLNNSHK